MFPPRASREPAPKRPNSEPGEQSYCTNAAVPAANQPGRIQVVVRIRPPTQRETDSFSNCIAIDGKRVTVRYASTRQEASCASLSMAQSGSMNSDQSLSCLSDSTSARSRKFVFDHVFDSSATQYSLFAGIGVELVDTVLRGVSSVLMCYGATSAGKTYTLSNLNPGREGLVVRCCQHIFERVQELRLDVRVSLSYYQIYLEQIFDLLNLDVRDASLLPYRSGHRQSKAHEYKGGRVPQGLPVRENPDGSVYIEGLTVHQCRSINDLLMLLSIGEQNKVFASTKLNQASSRSHVVLSLRLEISDGCADRVSPGGLASSLGAEPGLASAATGKRFSEFLFIDLAGSESLRRTGATGVQLDEAKFINRSLTALGQIIGALSGSFAHASVARGGGRAPSSPGKHLGGDSAPHSPAAGVRRSASAKRLGSAADACGATPSQHSQPSDDDGASSDANTDSLTLLADGQRGDGAGPCPPADAGGRCGMSKAAAHIPWRDSKLTRILQNVLSGNSRSALILNVSPMSDSAHETVTSFLFGRRAMGVLQTPKVNVELNYKRLSEELQEKLDAISARLGERDSVHFHLEDEARALRLQLEARSAECADLRSTLLFREQEVARLEGALSDVIGDFSAHLLQAPLTGPLAEGERQAAVQRLLARYPCPGAAAGSQDRRGAPALQPPPQSQSRQQPRAPDPPGSDTTEPTDTPPGTDHPGTDEDFERRTARLTSRLRRELNKKMRSSPRRNSSGALNVDECISDAKETILLSQKILSLSPRKRAKVQHIDEATDIPTPALHPASNPLFAPTAVQMRPTADQPAATAAMATATATTAATLAAETASAATASAATAAACTESLDACVQASQGDDAPTPVSLPAPTAALTSDPDACKGPNPALTEGYLAMKQRIDKLVQQLMERTAEVEQSTCNYDLLREKYLALVSSYQSRESTVAQHDSFLATVEARARESMGYMQRLCRLALAFSESGLCIQERYTVNMADALDQSLVAEDRVVDSFDARIERVGSTFDSLRLLMQELIKLTSISIALFNGPGAMKTFILETVDRLKQGRGRADSSDAFVARRVLPFIKEYIRGNRLDVAPTESALNAAVNMDRVVSNEGCLAQKLRRENALAEELNRTRSTLVTALEPASTADSQSQTEVRVSLAKLSSILYLPESPEGALATPVARRHHSTESAAVDSGAETMPPPVDPAVCRVDDGVQTLFTSVYYGDPQSPRPSAHTLRQSELTSPTAKSLGPLPEDKLRDRVPASVEVSARTPAFSLSRIAENLVSLGATQQNTEALSLRELSDTEGPDRLDLTSFRGMLDTHTRLTATNRHISRSYLDTLAERGIHVFGKTASILNTIVTLLNRSLGGAKPLDSQLADMCEEAALTPAPTPAEPSKARACISDAQSRVRNIVQFDFRPTSGVSQILSASGSMAAKNMAIASRSHDSLLAHVRQQCLELIVNLSSIRDLLIAYEKYLTSTDDVIGDMRCKNLHYQQLVQLADAETARIANTVREMKWIISCRRDDGLGRLHETLSKCTTAGEVLEAIRRCLQSETLVDRDFVQPDRRAFVSSIQSIALSGPGGA